MGQEGNLENSKDEVTLGSQVAREHTLKRKEIHQGQKGSEEASVLQLSVGQVDVWNNQKRKFLRKTLQTTHL